MSDEPTERVGFDWPDDHDVEALQAILLDTPITRSSPSFYGDLACAILSSGWLAQRDAQQRREGVAEVVARIEAVIGRESFGTFMEGRRTAHHNGAYDVCPVLDLRAALREPTP